MSMYEKLSGNKYFDYFEVKAQHDREGLSRDELMKIFEQEKQELQPFMHRYENPFMNIQNFVDKFFYMFSKGDEIVIQEKIDGSNTHLNVSNDSFKCFSNNFELNEKNHLQGFWYWCNDHFTQVPDKYFGLDIYGEWLTPHHCEYPAERYGEFYVFDVMEDGEYWSQDKVELLAKECNFAYAPIFYRGTFKSWHHVMSFVGKTMLGGDKGEGIVIKNQSTLNYTSKQFYVKIVDVEFQETNSSRQVIKTVNMERVLKMEEELMLSESIVTLPRIRKIVLKLIDAKELPLDWNVLDTKDLLRIIKPLVFKDCVKEEKEIVDKIGKMFGKYCNDITMNLIEQLKVGDFNE